MVNNHSELQYLNILKKIIIENAKEEYEPIRNNYESGTMLIGDAYNNIVQDKKLVDILDKPIMDRTGSGTYKTFGQMMRFNLQDVRFPLLTTKKVFVRGIFEELFWFIHGDTNIKTLVDKNVHIWDEWSYERFKKTEAYAENPISIQEYIQKIKNNPQFGIKYGDLGPIYGAQWRNFGGHDHFKNQIQNKLDNSLFIENFYHFALANQLKWEGSQGVDQLYEVIEKLKNNPNDRRMLVLAYNPNEVQDQALPACHAFFQFYVKNGELSCMMYQRSADMFLGVPFNIASYAALTHMIAQVTGLKPKEYIHVLGDAHIYSNHLEQVQEQLSRERVPK